MPVGEGMYSSVKPAGLPRTSFFLLPADTPFLPPHGQPKATFGNQTPVVYPVYRGKRAPPLIAGELIPALATGRAGGRNERARTARGSPAARDDAGIPQDFDTEDAYKK